MEFEDILEDIGGFGFYQKMLVVAVLVPTYIVLPWFGVGMIFMSNTPEHWCYVSEIAKSNLSLDMQKQLIRPLQDPTCSMHDINYSHILHSGNLTTDSSWPTKPCKNGWRFDKSEFDATAVTRWNLVCDDAHFSSLLISLTFIGNMCGFPLYTFLSDKLGRKPIFLFLALLISLSEISSVLIPNFVIFLVLRAVNGTGMTAIYATGYIIFLELVSPKYRTGMNFLTTTCWTGGLCLLALVAKLTRDWIHLSIVASSAAACLLLYWKLLPESPRWLISRGRYDEAHAIMCKISKMNKRTAHEGKELMQKIEQLGEKIKNERASGEKNSPLDLFTYPLLRKRFLLVTICWLGNTIPYYGLQVNVRNLDGNQFFNFFLISVVEIPAHLFGWYIIERFGRRWSSVSAFALSSAICLMPVFFYPDYPIVDIVASFFAKGTTSIAFMTVYLLSPELMPTSLRGVGLGLSGTIGMGAVLVVPYVSYMAKYGTYIPFLIFSFVALISGICASFLPETLNKNLPQTVKDAENFEKDFKFFSCSQNQESESDSKAVPSSWKSLKLSAVDLTSSIKNIVADETGNDIIVRKRNSVGQIPSLRL